MTVSSWLHPVLPHQDVFSSRKWGLTESRQQKNLSDIQKPKAFPTSPTNPGTAKGHSSSKRRMLASRWAGHLGERKTLQTVTGDRWPVTVGSSVCKHLFRRWPQSKLLYLHYLQHKGDKSCLRRGGGGSNRVLKSELRVTEVVKGMCHQARWWVLCCPGPTGDKAYKCTHEK